MTAASWTKINRIYKREFSGVSKEISPILDPHFSTSNMVSRSGKKPVPFCPKNVRKRKRIGIVKRYALTNKCRNSQRFLKTFIF